MVFVDCLYDVAVAAAVERYPRMFLPMDDVGARADLSAPSVGS
jgi:hypothetical protein